jgi:hypothetical protein
MAQYDFGTIDPSTTDGTELATLLGSFRNALNTIHSGTVRPSYAVGGTLWLDTTTGTGWILKLYDGASDSSLLTINPTGDLVTVPALPAGTTGKAILAASTQSDALTALGTGGMKYLGGATTNASFGSGTTEVNGGTATVTPISTVTLAMLYGTCRHTANAGSFVMTNRLLTGGAVSSTTISNTALQNAYFSFSTWLVITTVAGVSLTVSHMAANATGGSGGASTGVIAVFGIG